MEKLPPLDSGMERVRVIEGMTHDELVLLVASMDRALEVISSQYVLSSRLLWMTFQMALVGTNGKVPQVPEGAVSDVPDGGMVMCRRMKPQSKLVLPGAGGMPSPSKLVLPRNGKHGPGGPRLVK